MDRAVADNGSQLPLDHHGPDGESAFDIFVSPPLSPVSRSQHSLRDGGDDHLVSTLPEPYTSVCQPPNIDTASRPATLWPSQHPGKASTTRRSRGSTLSVSFADASASGHGTSQRGRQDGHSPRLTATEQFPQLPLASIAVASNKEEVTNTNESLATVFHSLPAHGRKYSRSMDGQGGIDRDTRSRGSLESTSSSIGSSSDDVTPVAPPTPGNGPLPTVSSPNGPSHTLSSIIQQRVTSHFIGSRLSISRMKKNRMTLMLQFVDPVQEDKYLQFAARINQSPVRFFTKGLVIPIVLLVWAAGPYSLIEFHDIITQCPSIAGYCYECYGAILFLTMLICIVGVVSLRVLQRGVGRSVSAYRRKMAVFVGFMSAFMSLKLAGTMCVGLCWVPLPNSLPSSLLDSSHNIIAICEAVRSDPLSDRLRRDARLAEVQIEVRHLLASVFLIMFLTISTIPVSQAMRIGMIGFTVTTLAYGAMSSMYTAPALSVLWLVLLSLVQDFLASMVMVFQRELLTRVSFLFMVDQRVGADGSSSLAAFLTPLATLYRGTPARPASLSRGRGTQSRRSSVSQSSVSAMVANFKGRFKTLGDSFVGESLVSAWIHRVSTPSTVNHHSWIERFVSRRPSTAAAAQQTTASVQPEPSEADQRRLSAPLSSVMPRRSTLADSIAHEVPAKESGRRSSSGFANSAGERQRTLSVGASPVFTADIAQALKLASETKSPAAGPPSPKTRRLVYASPAMNSSMHNQYAGRDLRAGPQSLLFRSPSTQESTTQQSHSQSTSQNSVGSGDLVRQPTLTLLETPATPATVVRTSTSESPRQGRHQWLPRNWCNRGAAEMQTMFYEFPSRDDEARFRAAYHQKLRKRIKAVLAVNTITAAISFSGLTLLRFATGNGLGQPGLTSGKITRWTILDGSDLIVNLSLLLGVLTVSSRCWQVSNKKLEAVCVMYLLLMFAAAMSTSVIQRRFNVDDRALLQLSNHRLVFSFFSVATLRLRPRVHICVVGLALVGLMPASWAVPADRKPDMVGLLLPAMLAALGSTTLCFMFESAYRRYFWLKHCTRNTTLGGKKAATAPRQPSPSPEA